MHPNDDVNMGQSSNDTFPTAMHVAAVQAVAAVVPSVTALRDAIAAKADAVAGRSQDRADPPGGRGAAHGRAGMVRATRGSSTQARSGLSAACADLYELAAGGTAVGTGLNAPPGFGAEVAGGSRSRPGTRS